MSRNQVLLALYVILTLVVFVTLFAVYGPMRGWLFAAFACGIPSVVIPR